MDLSVVVATLNGRDALAGSLDALSAAAPSAERIVVNGPSTDGTTGMVRERDDVDVLLELADRNVNVARNAGAAVASGDVVAFVDDRTEVGEGWADALVGAIADAAVVTGPIRRRLAVGSETSRRERDTVAGRSVTYFDGANVAFTREAIRALDGFDEYLDRGGAREVAHRLVGLGLEVGWADGLTARRVPVETGTTEPESPGLAYRELGYRLAKNYGPAPAALGCVLESAGRDGVTALHTVGTGEKPVSRWIGDGVAVASGGVRGVVDGLRARLAHRGPALNPNGISARDDRVVRRYDW